MLATLDWDDAVASDIRNKWVKNFLMMEQLRGLKFSRARMPSTALNTKMRLITLVDGAKELVMVGSYCGFRVEGGGWSNQHLMGRSAMQTTRMNMVHSNMCNFMSAKLLTLTQG